MIDSRFLLSTALSALGVLTLSACAQVSPAGAADAPAVLVQPTDASRHALSISVARMLGVTSVAVAQDALLQTSLMVIEKNRPRGADGIQLSGRDYDQPEQFRLIKSGNSCVLVKLRTGAREVLLDTQCAFELPN